MFESLLHCLLSWLPQAPGAGPALLSLLMLGSVVASDIPIYGSANMQQTDSGTQGGAIDLTKRIVPDSATLFNALADKIKIHSDNAADNSQTVTVTGRSSTGAIVSEGPVLNGTTLVPGTVTYARLEQIVISAAHTGNVIITKFSDGSVIATIESGVLTIVRPFYNVAADVSGGSARTYHEKCFYKNNNGTNAFLAMTVKENSDPSGNIDFAIESSVNGTGTSTNRVTAPAGITADGFSSSDKTIPGTDLAPGDKIGVWLRLSLAAGAAAATTTYGPRATGNTT